MNNQEPFDLSNTARSVNNCENFNKIKDVFEKSNAILRANKDSDVLVGTKCDDLNCSDVDVDLTILFKEYTY